MANPSRASLVEKILSGNGPIRPRSLALLFMLAGALGFVVTLVALDGLTICLFFSTVVVFTGLSVILLAKRYAGNAAQEVDDLVAEAPQNRYRPGLQPQWERTPNEKQMPTPAAATPTNRAQTLLHNSSQPAQVVSSGRSNLNERAAAVFAQRGANVFINNQRDNRSILTVESAAGERYIVMIDAGHEAIDVSDLRALNSVMANNQVGQGIFLCASSYTPQAQAWAEKRAIQLFEAYQVDSIQLD